MQSVQQLVNRFYHGIQDHYSIILIGLDNAGKTSLLYLLKDGKLVVTISTIGFNVETVRPPIMSRSGTTSRKGPAEVTVCDASIRGRASQDYFLALRMFAGCGDAVMWMVSSAESDRFQDSVDELRDALKRLEEDENSSQKPNPRPLLILANKQDLPGAKSIGEIRSVFAGILTKRPWSIVLPTSLERGLGVESGIPQALDWLQNAIKLSRERENNAGALMHRVPSLPPHRLQELNAWFSRLKGDVPPHEFLRKQFESFSVLRWDHYSKIRVMFHLLQKYGRQEGERVITKRLDKYRSLGPDAPNRETLSVTMTSFWVQVVHFAIVNERNPAHSASFTSFIATNPHVINEELWMEYYSKEVMMSQKARDEIVLPDKKALPSIIFRSQGLKVP